MKGKRGAIAYGQLFISLSGTRFRASWSQSGHGEVQYCACSIDFSSFGLRARAFQPSRPKSSCANVAMKLSCVLSSVWGIRAKKLFWLNAEHGAHKMESGIWRDSRVMVPPRFSRPTYSGGAEEGAMCRRTVE